MCKLFSRAPSTRSTNDEGELIISGIVGDLDLPTKMKRLVSISLAQWSLRMRLISHAGAVEPPGALALLQCTVSSLPRPQMVSQDRSRMPEAL